MADDGNGARTKKMKTCSSEMALKKITQIQSRMAEVLSGAKDKMEVTEEANAEVPLDFWQKRKLSSDLEHVPLTRIVSAMTEKENELEGSTETFLDNLADEKLRRLWSSVTSTPAPAEPPMESKPEEETPAVEAKTDSDKEPETVEKLEVQEEVDKSEEKPQVLPKEDPIAEENPPPESQAAPDLAEDEPPSDPIQPVEKEIVERDVQAVEDAVANQEVLVNQPMALDEPADTDKTIGNSAEAEQGGDDFMKMEVDGGDLTAGREEEDQQMNGTEETRENNDDDDPPAVEIATTTTATAAAATVTETHQS